MDNVVEFKPKQTPTPMTAEERKDRLSMWDRGFALYVMSVGVQTIAESGAKVAMTDAVIEQMNLGIRLMAEADYERMTQVVTNPLHIARALN